MVYQEHFLLVFEGHRKHRSKQGAMQKALCSQLQSSKSMIVWIKVGCVFVVVVVVVFDVVDVVVVAPVAPVPPVEENI